jgi:hypothetical protein
MEGGTALESGFDVGLCNPDKSTDAVRLPFPLMLGDVVNLSSGLLAPAVSNGGGGRNDEEGDGKSGEAGGRIWVESIALLVSCVMASPCVEEEGSWGGLFGRD